MSAMTVETDFLSVLRPRPPSEHDVLEVMNGPEDGRAFALRSGPMTIGRLEQSDIVLRLDQTISRSHARITKDGNRYFIEDMGSTHGVYVNGQRATGRTEIVDGAEIQLGATLLCLRALSVPDTGTQR
jgi:pSer/pThr/pTyr-binding forkhead associated (FHA) protein